MIDLSKTGLVCFLKKTSSFGINQLLTTTVANTIFQINCC